MIFREIILSLSVAVGSLFLLDNVAAQSFADLYSFPPFGAYATNSAGAQPEAGLTLCGEMLFGTATSGGSLGHGTVFKMSVNGTGFTTIYNFTGVDGSMPIAGVTPSGNSLFGSTYYGGSANYGMLFKINNDGSDFTNIHNFNMTDGARPTADLVNSGNTLYGAALGGTYGHGTIFKLNTDGTGFTNLYNFTGGNDGAGPNALTLAGNILYGVTGPGASSNGGTIFRLNTDGSGFTNLYTLNSSKDGNNPRGRLFLAGSSLYGTAYQGGKSNNGTIFRINVDGSSFTNLHDFSGGFEGGNPVCGVTLYGHTLYGTASSDCVWGANGTLFAIDTNGSAFTVIHTFSNDMPYGMPLLSSNTLYGTVYEGGNGYGSIFSLNLIPNLTVALSAKGLILSWPTNAVGFTLQATTNLVSSTAWTPVLTPPVIVNGQNVVTNSIVGASQYYRLTY